MAMSPRLSKAVLTSHITFSVGWIGAVAVFLVLAIRGLTSDDVLLVRASLISMEFSAWFVIVPFCLISLLTGIVQATATKWGLFKHYWIVVKLFLTVASTLLLLLHMKPISFLATAASVDSFSSLHHSDTIIDMIKKSAAAIIVLLFITTISVYKPWGKIKSNSLKPYTSMPGEPKSKKPWSFYALIGLVVLIMIFIISHLAGGGMRGH